MYYFLCDKYLHLKKEFGLSDNAMNCLKTIKDHKAECIGEITSDIINFFLENETFWDELNYRLPAYFNCLNYRTDSTNIDMARYGIIRVFEELLDELINELYEIMKKKELPLAELEPTSAFPQKKY